MTSNPMTKIEVMRNDDLLDARKMTAVGAINKTFLLLGIVVLVAMYSWNLCATGYVDKAHIFLWAGIIGGLILAIITSFKPQSSNITAPVYAFCEGLVIGTLSFIYESLYDGIVIQAAGLTVLTLFSMLFLYKAGVIKATERLKQVVITATVAIAIFYTIGLIGLLLGHPMTIFDGSLVGIGVNAVICIIAALNFILDFDFIEKGEQMEFPKCFEWYGGFVLLVTIVWLYVELLKLLAQLRKR